MDVTRTVNGVRVIAFSLARPLHVGSLEFNLETAHTWYLGHLLTEEQERGYPDHLDDDLLVATGTVELEPGASATLVLSAEDHFPLDKKALLDAAARLDEALLDSARRVAAAPLDGFSERLVLAAGQFIVRRDTEGARGTTVLAGYHWFSDWGRDTMISLPGLCLQTGRPAIARAILTTFARFVDRGMIPNRFPDSGGAPEYNTVDATLWFIEAIRAYVDATGDATLATELWPCLEEIIRWHESGTRYGIGVDHEDGLLRSGVPGVQLTWMDAKSGERVFTPRDGKCVEINALYHNALCALGWLAERVGHGPEQWVERANRIRRSFERFWDSETGYCFDVIDGPNGNDASLRPNQIFAVSLPESPLDLARQRAVVETCQKHLLTPFGLRTLAPWHPDYQGVYEGSPETRDGRYHQGTVWAWLLGPFALAHYRVNADAKAALSFLQPLSSHLSEHGMGSISEIFDGDPPHRPRGCIAQAWSVAETLRAWRILVTTR
jgi:predicted glycogen debranching enzyme